MSSRSDSNPASVLGFSNVSGEFQLVDVDRGGDRLRRNDGPATELKALGCSANSINVSRPSSRRVRLLVRNVWRTESLDTMVCDRLVRRPRVPRRGRHASSLLDGKPREEDLFAFRTRSQRAARPWRERTATCASTCRFSEPMDPGVRRFSRRRRAGENASPHTGRRPIHRRDRLTNTSAACGSWNARTWTRPLAWARRASSPLAGRSRCE